MQFKRNSLNDGSQLVAVNSQWLAAAFLILFARLLEPPLHCMFISSSNVVVGVASCLHCFMTHFELKEKKNHSNFMFV